VSTLAARVDEISGQVRYDRAWLRGAWAVVWLTLISFIALATALWWHWARGRHARCPYCGGDGSAGDSCPACEGWAEERATREAAGPLPAPATDPAPPAPPPAADE